MQFYIIINSHYYAVSTLTDYKVIEITKYGMDILIQMISVMKMIINAHDLCILC